MLNLVVVTVSLVNIYTVHDLSCTLCQFMYIRYTSTGPERS